MSRIYEDLDMIRKRPGMYLGALSVSKMRTFLDGYRFAIRDETEWINEIPGNPLHFKLFNAFVARKYQVSGCIGWCGIILEQVGGDEEKGLQLFWELLDEFREIKVEKCFRTELSKENISYHENNKEVLYYYHILHEEQRIPVYRGAKKIHKLILDKNRGVLLVVEYEDAFCIESIYDNESQYNNHIESCFGTVCWEEEHEQTEKQKLLVSHRHIDENGAIRYWFI